MDPALVVMAQRGDERAFEQLAAEAYPRLYRLAHGILRDASLADDATQDALVHIWRNLPRLRDASCYESWCYRLLLNTCRDQVRRAPRWVAIDLTPNLEPQSHDDLDPLADRALLEQALARLSLEHRSVLALRYLLDLTPEEVAATLGIPRKTVYSRLKRAAASLRAVVDAEARPAPSPALSGEITR